MKLDRVMIAAPKSGSGKTMITCALLQLLKNRDRHVVSFKCGPDYIDPMFHQKVIGIPSRNLDTFFSGENEVRQLLLRNRRPDEIAVVEGVMGLYDGLGGIREEGSAYHLATVTGTPILLVVDAKGMGRSVIPLIKGFLQYDVEHRIKGILLNRMSKAYYEVMKPLIEEEAGVPVVGFFPENKEYCVESRHLGLVMPDELQCIREQLQAVALAFDQTVSVEQILQIAASADELEAENTLIPGHAGEEARTLIPGHAGEEGEMPLIAVARDEAFCFYYEDNLELLRARGARIQYFSPIHDKGLPGGCSAILLGGGYPELYGAELSQNAEMRQTLYSAIQNGMPVVAECGGFMYLHKHIVDKEKRAYEMVGAIPADCHDTRNLVRFGYIELTDKEGCFLPQGDRIKGHEFHYFDSEINGDSCAATKPVTGKTYPCVIANQNQWLGFPHLYYPSNPRFADSFVEKAREYAKSRTKTQK